MKKVLIIVHGFPAEGGTRTEKIVKYLPQFGWEGIVLTNDRLDSNPFADEVLANASLRSMKFHPTKPLPDFAVLGKFNLNRMGSILNRLFFLPDITLTWLPHALIKARKIIKTLKPKIIYSISPLEGTHLTGHLLQKITHLPWVADFTDLWTLYQGRYKPLTGFHDMINTRLEKTFYLKSDAIIANTKLNKSIISQHFGITPSKISVITNGFDPDEMFSANCAHSSKRIVIGYFGAIEKPAFCYKAFIAAYEKAITEGAQFHLQYWGVVTDKLRNFVQQNSVLSSHITFNGYMPHKKCMQRLAEANALLLLLKNGYEYIVPQKLYHYLALKKPILAIVPPEGCAAEIVKRTNSGVVFSPDHVDQLSSRLLDFYKIWQQDSLKLDIKDEALSQYSYENLTGKLTTVFDSVLSGMSYFSQ